VEADRLSLTNGALSQFNFKSGRLNARNSTANNTQLFTVGNGGDWARFDLKGGTHSFANDLGISSNAWLTGSGTIVGNVTNAGVLAPGDSLGGLAISGNLQLQPNGDVAFDLDGHTAGVDYDSLSASGNIFWNGRLHVTLESGFTPGPSDVFTLAQCAGDSGSFVNVTNGGTLVTEDQRGSFVVTYGNSALQLSNFQALNPTNAFKLAVVNSGLSSVTLQFPFEFGRTYHLWFSTNLTSWIELPVPGYVFPQPGVAQWSDDGSLTGGNPVYAPSPRFYRVSLE